MLSSARVLDCVSASSLTTQVKLGFLCPIGTDEMCSITVVTNRLKNLYQFVGFLKLDSKRHFVHKWFEVPVSYARYGWCCKTVSR